MYIYNGLHGYTPGQCLAADGQAVFIKTHNYLLSPQVGSCCFNSQIVVDEHVYIIMIIYLEIIISRGGSSFSVRGGV